MYLFNASFYIEENDILAWNSWVRGEFLPRVEEASGGLKGEQYEVISSRAGSMRIFSIQWRCVEEELDILDKVVAEQLGNYQAQGADPSTWFCSIMKML